MAKQSEVALPTDVANPPPYDEHDAFHMYQDHLDPKNTSSRKCSNFIDCLDPLNNNGNTTFADFSKIVDHLTEHIPKELQRIIMGYVLCAINFVKCDIVRDKGFFTNTHTLYMRDIKNYDKWAADEKGAERSLYAEISKYGKIHKIYDGAGVLVATITVDSANRIFIQDKNDKVIGDCKQTQTEKYLPLTFTVLFVSGKGTIEVNSVLPVKENGVNSITFDYIKVTCRSARNTKFEAIHELIPDSPVKQKEPEYDANGVLIAYPLAGGPLAVHPPEPPKPPKYRKSIVECGKQGEGQYSIYVSGNLSILQGFVLYLLSHICGF